MDWGQCANLSVANADNVASIQCLVPLFVNVVQAVVGLGAVALFIMLLSGGFNFLFSQGDPKKLEAARGTITQALAGIVVMSLAYLILLTIQNFTGVNVTLFNLPGN